jgi:hypothetical protein
MERLGIRRSCSHPLWIGVPVGRAAPGREQFSRIFHSDHCDSSTFSSRMRCGVLEASSPAFLPAIRLGLAPAILDKWRHAYVVRQIAAQTAREEHE